MEDRQSEIELLKAEIDDLKNQLFEASNIIEAIREGSVDALVFDNNGNPEIYAIESADYTYRLLIEKFSEGALSISYNGLITYCNEYFSELTGVPLNKIAGTYLNDYFEVTYNYSILKETLSSGNIRTETVLIAKNKKIPVYISFTDLQPSVPAIGIIITDLTQKKKNEEALLKYQQQLEKKVSELDVSNASLSQFIHVVAHDLKEPVRKLLAYTSRLNTSTESNYTQGELNHIGIIKASGNRLNSLVDDIVKYSFISNKEDEFDISLNDVFTDVKEDLEIIIRESNAVINCEKLPVIKGSAVQMRQVFSNLIVNAIKYSKSDVNPLIDISCSIVNPVIPNKQISYYKISFTDNGIGMDNQYINKIFTIFQRLHLRTQYSGNGIGLAICKKVMDNHNGYIDVTSALGVGSTFNIYIPILP